MFTKLTDFKYRRTAKEAFGFYIAYLLLIFLIGVVVASVVSSLNSSLPGLEGGFRVWPLVTILSCVFLSYLVVKKKKLTHKFGAILLIVLSGVLAVGGTPVLGILPAAFLTTKK